MIRNIVSITSACTTLTASYFLIKDILKLSPKLMIKVCSIQNKLDKDHLIELSKQNANNKIGFILLLFSFICQLIVLSTFPKIEQMCPPKLCEIIISIVIGFLILLLSLCISKYLHNYTMKRISNIRRLL